MYSIFTCGRRALVVIPYSFQRLAVYTFFGVRLYDSFKNTFLKIKCITLCLLLVVVSIIILGFAAVYIYVAYKFSYGFKSFYCNYNILTNLALAIVAFDLIGNAVLTSVYAIKLRQVKYVTIVIYNICYNNTIQCNIM